MKKLLLSIFLIGSLNSANARVDYSRCTKISLGFVTIWSGQATIIDDTTGLATGTTSCGGSNGSWVWFWE